MSDLSFKIKNLILVDDDTLTNFINKKIITDLKVAENIVVFNSPSEGLDYFQSAFEGKVECPEVLLLDLNMPAITGWDFLEKLNTYPVFFKEKITVFILSSSLNPDDKEKADNSDMVKGFFSKPLQKEVLLASI